MWHRIAGSYAAPSLSVESLSAKEKSRVQLKLYTCMELYDVNVMFRILDLKM